MLRLLPTILLKHRQFAELLIHISTVNAVMIYRMHLFETRLFAKRECMSD